MKEIVTHLINDLEYDKNKLGKATSLYLIDIHFLKFLHVLTDGCAGLLPSSFVNRYHGLAWFPSPVPCAGYRQA